MQEENTEISKKKELETNIYFHDVVTPHVLS